MENILRKNIFDDRVLDKLAPDYTPNNLVLRMQMRRTLTKDSHSHSHGISRSTTWTRKSIKKTKDSYNINKEIVKLRYDFNNINLKNGLTLKGSDTFKIKAVVSDNNLSIHENVDANEDFGIDFLPQLPDDNDLEIRNDNEFKINTKTKSVRNVKFEKENRKHNKPKQGNGELLDLNKDINENNEDIFKIACIYKGSKPAENYKLLEQTNKDSCDKNNDSPVNTDRSIGDLQKLLVMMAITSKPAKDNEEKDSENDNFSIENHKSELYHYDNDNIDPNDTTNNVTIDNILSITPLRAHIDDNVKYLMEKYSQKWKDYVSNRKKYIDEQRKATLNNFFDKIAKKKMDIDNNSDEYENKAKYHLRDYNTYQNRYRMQKHIIAIQKAKLEEQNRVIEELKYNKIIESSRQSVDELREQVRKAYYDIDRQLKPKIKCLTKELKIPELEEPSLVLHCLKVPQFLQRMERRAREREEKHALIRERRQQMEEDRIKMKQQTELARAEMDKDEKMRRLKELKEKRKKERIETIRKKQWTERLRALIVMADLHYEKTLMSKYGIAPLRKLVEVKRDNIEKARAHYRFQLKHNVFLNWMFYTEDMWFERNFKADDFYRKTLLRKTFIGFKMILYSVTLKRQVAEDFYDLYVTQLGFRLLCEGLKVIKKEQELKWQKAVTYYDSNLLFKAFVCWRTLPALNALKREQEARKARWREKVLQVVPDYKPPED